MQTLAAATSTCKMLLGRVCCGLLLQSTIKSLMQACPRCIHPMAVCMYLGMYLLLCKIRCSACWTVCDDSMHNTLAG